MPTVPPNRGPRPPPPTNPPWVRPPLPPLGQQQPPQAQEVPWRKNLKPTPVPEPKPSNVSTPTAPTSNKMHSTSAKPSTTTHPPSSKQNAGPNKISRNVSVTTIPIQRVQSQVAKAPPLPPPAPPPPPPPPPSFSSTNRPPKPPHIIAKIEKLKRPCRKRPDLGQLMKEIEEGRKLKHVECNDRSKPIIPKMQKASGKFVFNSEAKPANKADAVHNKLLNEIQSGVKLKKVQCNDRSKPILSGLQTSVREVAATTTNSETNQQPVQEELTFEFDIDVLRDELQSAKQMLELEMQNKADTEKKNRDQRCQIIAMEAEINTLKAELGLVSQDDVSMVSKEQNKSLRKSGSGLWKSPSIVGIKKSKSGINREKAKEVQDFQEMEELEEQVQDLTKQVEKSKRESEKWENKFKEMVKKLLAAEGTIDDLQSKQRVLEKQMETERKKSAQNVAVCAKCKQNITSSNSVSQQPTNNASAAPEEEDEEEEEEEEEEEDSDEEVVNEETIQEKKEEREIKLWENKLRSVKEKQNASKQERKTLKITQKKLEKDFKDAKEKHKKLQNDLNSMACASVIWKGGAPPGDGDDDEDEEEEEEDTESEESESEDDDDEDGSTSEEDDADNSHEERLRVYGKRVKRRENVLGALKKGNYLLSANIDRLREAMHDEKIKYQELEAELSSLADV